MYNHNCPENWATDDELDFILRIGTHVDRNKNKSKINFLKKYKEVARRRYDWGLIDRQVVLTFVNSLIIDEISLGRG